MASSKFRCAGPMGRREVVRGHARQRVKPSLKIYSLATIVYNNNKQQARKKTQQTDKQSSNNHHQREDLPDLSKEDSSHAAWAAGKYTRPASPVTR
eukprot:scaffold25227_cov101-Isochrysis_galbana.AAC.1